ncbi:MAG: PCP reductase family protein [Candidatus Rokubacteria bacterium]|nr:PCP reductase family protein [Candidatus Rokubacteria bacterium]MBI3109268.1 PCP reductase family protein [Candidatus Rokubacteria bacterium]
MKLLCVACNEPMQVSSVEGPEEGSVSVSFGCATCGQRVALLTNPLETQLVRSLGVKIGGQSVGHEPLEVVRASLAPQSQGALHAAEGEAVVWTEEANARLQRLPPMARPMARTAIARYAREHGVTTVTPELMDEYRAHAGF